MDALAHAHARVKATLHNIHEAFIVSQFQLDMWVLQKKSGEHGLQDHGGRDSCRVEAQRSSGPALKNVQFLTGLDDLPKGWADSREIQRTRFRQAHASGSPVKQ